MAFKKGQSISSQGTPLGAANQSTLKIQGWWWFKALILVLFIQGPSLRDWFKFFSKYIPIPGLVLAGLVMAVTFMGYWFILRFWPTLRAGRLAILATSKWLFLGLFAAVLMAALLLYPLADALKFQGAGSDQDDALILGAKDILTGSPYASKTYSNNPQSGGPGWTLLALPFAATGAYPLFFPSLLACLGLALKRRTGSWRTGNLFLLLASTGLIFWDLTVVGSDMISWGLAAALALLLVERFARRSPRHLAWLAVLVGCLATGRIVFLPFPLLAGLFLWQQGARKEALAIALGSMSVALGLHLGFYFWTGGNYHPLHLIGKGCGLLEALPPWVLALAFAAGCCLAFVVYRLGKGGLDRWMLAAWVATGLPLALVAFADLASRHFNLAQWEGANYMGPALPFLLCWLAWEEHGAQP